MKKIFTIISALLFSYSLVSAQDEAVARKYPLQSKLSITSTSNDEVKVIVDGNSFNSTNDDDAKFINNIRPGYHSIRIFQKRKGRYNERKFSRNMQLVYESNLYIKPQYHVDIVVNRFGKAFVDEKQIDNGYYAGYDNDGGNEWSNNDIQPMNGRKFDQFKYVIANESFDNTRLILAKQTIATNNFSAAQVKEIVQLFSFDNNKLDIAKYSYRNTVDKNNYYVVNDAFAFSSSKEELAKYVESCK